MSDITVMVVDDSLANRTAISKMLWELHYNVIAVNSGKDCLEKVSQSVPDIILLDVNMPEMTGYEVCTELRQRETTASTPILFVSAMDTVEERLAGFEAGGDEYLIKPVNIEQLLEKIKRNLEVRLEVHNMQKNAKEAMSVAFEAMTSNSEMGQIINFVRDAQTVKTLDEMGSRVCSVVKEFGLNSCALIEGTKTRFFGCRADSIEARLLEKCQISHERIFNKGIRTIVQSDQVVLLIKNMPIEDERKYGRFKDNLTVLISICDGRILTLKTQRDLIRQRKKAINRVITVAEKQLKTFSNNLLSHDEKMSNIIMDMIAQLEAKLFSLGLDDDQEAALMKLAYGASEQLEKAKDSTKELEDQLSAILDGLYKL